MAEVSKSYQGFLSGTSSAAVTGAECFSQLHFRCNDMLCLSLQRYTSSTLTNMKLLLTSIKRGKRFLQVNSKFLELIFKSLDVVVSKMCIAYLIYEKYV